MVSMGSQSGTKLKRRNNNFHSIFLLCHTACGILISHPGTEPVPWEWKCQVLSLNCQGIPKTVFFKLLKSILGIKKTKSKQKLKMSFRHSDQIRSVAQSCPILRDPMNRSTPGLPGHHQLLEFTETHVHWVSDAIQPSHPLSSPSPPAPNPTQHQG